MLVISDRLILQTVYPPRPVDLWMVSRRQTRKPVGDPSFFIRWVLDTYMHHTLLTSTNRMGLFIVDHSSPEPIASCELPGFFCRRPSLQVFKKIFICPKSNPQIHIQLYCWLHSTNKTVFSSSTTNQSSINRARSRIQLTGFFRLRNWPAPIQLPF